MTKTTTTETTATANALLPCSCGTSTHHVIARRMTADGIGVALHHDGAVTGRFGSGLEGVPVVRPRTREARELARRVGWLFAGEVSLYDYSELGPLYAACRWAATRDGLPGTVRARMAKPEIRSRCEDGRVLAEALERIADGQAARRVEIEASDA